MVRPILVALSVVSLATTAAAQEAGTLPAPGDAPAAKAELAHVPVDLSLVPPISINGERAARNHLSLGLGAARSGKLEGVALAPLHWTDGEVDGLQATWAAAIAGGTVRGAQVGAVTVAPGLQGLQAANLVTLAKGEVSGLQASGITAISTGRLAGVQASGVFNWADRIDGLQASTVNHAGAATGLQWAVVNIGGAVRGAQIGVVNLADTVDGAQLGVVNLARSSDASVGLFSLVGDGTHDVELFATEFSPVNAGVRLGGRHVYGLLVGGVQPREQEDLGEVRWTYGAGIGGRVELADRFRLDLDLLAQNVVYGEAYDTDDGENVLGSLRALVGFEATPWLSAFAGPTLSVYTAKEENRNIDRGTDLDLWGETRAWVGFAAGLRL